MTAERWWVKSAARWLARFDGVKAHIQAVSLSITAFSTFSIMLQGFGLDRYIPYLGVAGVVGGVVWTYYYTEGGVWNQVSRDRVDMSDNYSGPTMLFDASIEAKQLAYLAYVLQSDEKNDLDEIIAKMDELTVEEWKKLRDGVDVDEVAK